MGFSSGMWATSDTCPSAEEVTNNKKKGGGVYDGHIFGRLWRCGVNRRDAGTDCSGPMVAAKTRTGYAVPILSQEPQARMAFLSPLRTERQLG